jgi:competence protein ComEA
MSWLKDYLSFSKRERNAFIGLVVIIGGFIFLPNFFAAKKAPAAISEQVKKELGESKTSTNQSSKEEDQTWQTPFSDPKQKREIRLFEFDPNTLDEDGFITLGVPERTARTIINYRNKGGKFRKPDDLRKIYSLKKEDADRIIPYARVTAANTYSSPSYSNTFENKEYPKKTTVTVIDINTATVEEWKSLPGIGEILSARIVKFRQSIGGFSSIEQVAKTYGLRDSTFQLIKPFLKLTAPAVNKININTASENELMECNAVSKDIAQAIIIYRKQKGPFTNVDDLKKIVFINEEIFKKMAPCLKAE